MNANTIKQLPLLKDGISLFEQENCRYVVPIYQRSFAWGTGETLKKNNELVQLVDDIWDSRGKGGEYYLGTLVVNKREHDEENEWIYEVIDGQQRLTALFIIFANLGLIADADRLKYQCRNWADDTLRELTQSRTFTDANKKYEGSVIDGAQAVEEALKGKDREAFKRALEKTVLFRVEVPQGTDLNHYFEIMNTRGEQLEPQDIVKAKLMESLSTPERKAYFAKVWDACSDMNGYVQMKFGVKTRDILFLNKAKDNWDVLPEKLNVGEEFCKNISFKTLKNAILSIQEPADEDPDDDVEVKGKDGYYARFSGVIDFTHFLMHVLKVYQNPTSEQDVGDLDDKDLIDYFKLAQRDGLVNACRVSDEEFAWGFLECLLICRCLFDRYIIKREREVGDVDGKWSLKELKMSKSRQSRSAAYEPTKDCDGQPNEELNERVRMIQSCLRVSYTSPKSMHWITATLRWLYNHRAQIELGGLSTFCDGFAKKGVEEFWKDDEYDQKGVDTPHIVLNYLDFVLWDKICRGDGDIPRVCSINACDSSAEPFTFEFRITVEHLYPQHPSDFDAWKEVDQFGNLAILPRSENSRFSNLKPNAKKEQFGDKIQRGSLKLRIMSRLTPEGSTGEEKWRTDICLEHGKHMLQILETAVPRPKKEHSDNGDAA